MSFQPHHTAFTVSNMDESVTWYQEKLGFAIKHRYNKHGMEIAILELDKVRLELFCYGETTKPLPEYRTDLMEDLHVIGTKHLSIQVDNIDQIVEELKGKGVEFVMNIDTVGFGGRYTFFKDCNGILVEFFEV